MPLHRTKIVVESSKAILAHLNRPPLGLVKAMASTARKALYNSIRHSISQMVRFLFSHKTLSCSETLSAWLENSQGTESREHAEAAQPKNYAVSQPTKAVPNQNGISVSGFPAHTVNITSNE